MAPGTVGSAVALLIGAGLLRSPWPVPALALAAALAAGLGLWSVRRAAEAGDLGAGGDPGWVVIDEFAGQWIAMLPLARPSLAGCALAFALFRLFDVGKPGPVGWIDRQHGAWAVMGDDLVAGAMAAGCVGVVRWALPGVLG